MDTETKITERKVAAVGRCHACKKPMRVEYTRRSVATTTWGLTGIKTSRRTTFTREGMTAVFSQTNVRCSCGVTAVLSPVDGTKTEHVCDARCTNATGHVCECSCGGANHGKAHTVSA